MMDWAETERNTDGVATNAIQAAIALGDAYTVFFLQRRCRGQDHHEVIRLVAQCSSSSSPEVGQWLQRILSRKSEVEYEAREVRPGDARELAKYVRKLSSLVHSAVT